jgi:hypothetical protein
MHGVPSSEEAKRVTSNLLFLGADEETCEAVAAECRVRGWGIVTAALGSPDVESKVISESAPAALVICLDGLRADQVSQIAARLAADDREDRPLLMFAGGTTEDVAQLKAVASHAVFVKPDEVDWMLKHLVVKY